jgi:hypothetical protein
MEWVWLADGEVVRPGNGSVLDIGTLGSLPKPASPSLPPVCHVVRLRYASAFVPHCGTTPRQERGVWRLLLFGFTEGNQGNKDWKSSSLPSPARDTDFVACSRKRSLSEFASVLWICTFALFDQNLYLLDTKSA